jgi:hypothetical protein
MERVLGVTKAGEISWVLVLCVLIATWGHYRVGQRGSSCHDYMTYEFSTR